MAKKVLVPGMKFVEKNQNFGSFHRPDFSDPNCYILKIMNELDEFESATDSEKAELWITYRNAVKKVFGDHRSSKTNGIKNVFLKGKEEKLGCMYKTIL